MGYLKRERNYLPWIVALKAFKTILSLLKPRANDSDVNERRVVYERFRTWVINLMMPYFYDNGYNDNEDATEEERHLKEKMKDFACRRLKHQPCLRFQSKQGALYMKPLSDEEYCEEMLPKIVHQSNVDIDVALDALERCAGQVMDSPNREELMAKVTSKVVTMKEVKRLAKWEKEHQSFCSSKDLPQGAACYGGNALEWAKGSIEQVIKKSEAREKCRDMVFHTIKNIFV